MLNARVWLLDKLYVDFKKILVLEYTVTDVFYTPDFMTLLFGFIITMAAGAGHRTVQR